jgi:hypothetical protein
MELHGKYTLIGEGVRGSLCQAAHRQIRSSTRASEPQKFGIGIKELWQVTRRSTSRAWCSTRSAGRSATTGGGSFIYHFGDNLVYRRLRGAPELREPVSVALRRVPALQDIIPLFAKYLEGRQAHGLRRARHHRGRLAVDAEAHLPGRRADRLLGRLRQRAAHQGQPQRHEVGMLAAEAAFDAHARRAALGDELDAPMNR